MKCLEFHCPVSERNETSERIAVQGGTYWYIPVHPLLDTWRYEKCQNCTYQYIPVRTDIWYFYGSTYWYVQVCTFQYKEVQGGTLSVLKSHFNWPPAMIVSYCKTVVQPLRRKIRWHTLVAKGVGPLGGPVGEVLWELFYLSEMVSFDSEDLKRVRALSPLGQKHTAWIRTGNLPVI